MQRLVVVAVTTLALFSAWHLGPHTWRRLHQDYATYRPYTDLQRRQAFFAGLEEDPGVFAFFKQYPIDSIVFGGALLVPVLLSSE